MHDAVHPPSRPTRGAAWILLAAATLLVLVSASQTYLFRAVENAPVTIWRALAASAPVWYFWAAVTPLILRLGRAFPLGERPVRSFAVHLLAAVLLAVPHAALVAWVSLQVFPPEPQQPAFMIWFRNYFVARLQFELLTYFSILGAAHAVDFYRRYRERALVASLLEAQLAQAQLQALKMQLHPHFLFNTLHAISVLIREDPAAATRTVTLLGDLLRLTLASAGTQEVPLRQELEFLKLYLEIERTRFPDRLSIAFGVPPETLDLAVPNFILQPIVENAVRYGIAPRSEPGRISIAARRHDGALELEVWNDGPPLAEPSAPRRDGIGLATTRARLEKLYGSAARLEIANAEPAGVRVRVALPARAAATPAPIHG